MNADNGYSHAATKAALQDNHLQEGDSKRRGLPRSMRDFCVIVVDGMTYPVENWSPSGVLFQADGGLFGVGQPHDFTIKFKLADRIVSVTHKANVARKTKTTVALAFEPLTADVRSDFMHVLEALSKRSA